ncbi:MAG TPA: hypothetical protein VFE52_02630 [Devosia sp.]|jgi:hypothetical protein|nr:hypothetical protein [Devosia sp.]
MASNANISRAKLSSPVSVPGSLEALETALEGSDVAPDGSDDIALEASDDTALEDIALDASTAGAGTSSAKVG